MTKSDKLLFGTFFVVLVTMVYSFYKLNQLRAVKKIPAINASEPVLLTAAHCVASTEPTVFVALNPKEPLGIPATFVAKYDRAEYAMYSGDFNMLLKGRDLAVVRIHDKDNKFFCSGVVLKLSSVDDNPISILESMNNRKVHLISCGFAYGGYRLCMPFIPRKRSYTAYSGKGLIYYGMSGGPVIDIISGKVVALNTAIGENGESIVSPLVALTEGLEITVENK